MRFLSQFWPRLVGKKYTLPSHIRSTDIFLVSFPKSGNTWLRFIVANILDNTIEWSLKNINQRIPGVYNHLEEINNYKGQRFIKIHDPAFSKFPKYIYIYRDYRDVLVSYYFFLKGSGKYSGTLSEFIRGPVPSNSFGAWSDHLSLAFKDHLLRPESSLILSYEGLEKNTEENIVEIANFIGVKLLVDPSEIAEKCSFKNLKGLEERYGRVFDEINRPFFREGKSGDWKNHLTDEDLRFILDQKGVEELMSKLNYLKG